MIDQISSAILWRRPKGVPKSSMDWLNTGTIDVYDSWWHHIRYELLHPNHVGPFLNRSDLATERLCLLLESGKLSLGSPVRIVRDRKLEVAEWDVGTGDLTLKVFGESEYIELVRKLPSGVCKTVFRTYDSYYCCYLLYGKRLWKDVHNQIGPFGRLVERERESIPE